MSPSVLTAVDRQPPRRRCQVTDDDVAMVRWLARHRFATAVQLSRRFGRSAGQLRHRRGHLVAAGYLASVPVRPWEPWVTLCTPAGIALSGLSLPTPEYSPVAHAHTLGCVDIAIGYELAGATVITEREARSPALADRDWSTVDAKGRRSYPDLIVVTPGRRLAEAVKLELHARSPQTWATTLNGYRASQLYGQVTYWLPGDLASRFARVVNTEGLAHLVRIRAVVPGAPTLSASQSVA